MKNNHLNIQYFRILSNCLDSQYPQVEKKNVKLNGMSSLKGLERLRDYTAGVHMTGVLEMNVNVLYAYLYIHPEQAETAVAIVEMSPGAHQDVLVACYVNFARHLLMISDQHASKIINILEKVRVTGVVINLRQNFFNMQHDK